MKTTLEKSTRAAGDSVQRLVRRFRHSTYLDFTEPQECPLCRGKLEVKDHRAPWFSPPYTASKEWRYEVTCDTCEWCDCNGYANRREVLAAYPTKRLALAPPETAPKIMKPNTNTEAAETVQTTGDQAVAPAAPCSLRLFEISALVSYHAVILAESKEAALKEVETWENAWHDTGEFVDVSDVDVFDVRPMKSELEDWDDEAHCYTTAAGDAIRAAVAARDAADEDEISSENDSPIFALRYYVDPPRWFEKWAAIGPCFTTDPAKAASFPSHDDAMRESGKFPVMCPTDVVHHPA